MEEMEQKESSKVECKHRVVYSPLEIKYAIDGLADIWQCGKCIKCNKNLIFKYDVCSIYEFKKDYTLEDLCKISSMDDIERGENE